MMDDQILNDFLDNAVSKAKENIKTQGKLATEDAIPLMLKSQFNHIAHLEEEMVTKKEFNSLKEQFEFVKWLIMFGFTFLAALQIYIGFFKGN